MVTPSDFNRPDQIATEEEAESTILDWFAARAMEAIVGANMVRCGETMAPGPLNPDTVARSSYSIAEAMILQRRDSIRKLSLSRKNTE